MIGKALIGAFFTGLDKRVCGWLVCDPGGGFGQKMGKMSFLSPKLGRVQTEKEGKGGSESEPRHSWFLIEKKLKRGMNNGN
ncbi:hypothetical protein ABE29_01150 [Cytobacillus firmus]|nr:hypothetical protein [Cytobacillus firmus]MBG9552836.1 hypothetical protein [Cytobacillus firmus]MBG9559261.1 hypothetical protein [Cytobacillus firmus]MBG9577455.1 hypothetical protein [Cytobacillus firmus]